MYNMTDYEENYLTLADICSLDRNSRPSGTRQWAVTRQAPYTLYLAGFPRDEYAD
jgi:hypothetical protein